MSRIILIMILVLNLFSQKTTMEIVHINNTAVSNTKLFIGKDFIISKSDPFWLYFDHNTKKVYEFDAKKNIMKEMLLYDKISAVHEIKTKVGKTKQEKIKNRVIHDFLCKGLKITGFNEIPINMTYYYTDIRKMSKTANLDVLNDFRKFSVKINSDDIDLPKDTWPILVEVEKNINGQRLYYTVEVLKVHDKFTDEAFVQKMIGLYNRAKQRR